MTLMHINGDGVNTDDTMMLEFVELSSWTSVDDDEQSRRRHHEIMIKMCQSLRCQVFVEEQNIPKDAELDGLDFSSRVRHVMVRSMEQHQSEQQRDAPTIEIIGTGRIVFPDDDDETRTATIGRIAVRKEYRGKGIGRQIVQKLEQIARKQNRLCRIQLTPHYYLQSFYEQLGFVRLEDNEMKHINQSCQLITMEKQLQQPRRICLFGTSANPPTGCGGHLGVVNALLKLQCSCEGAGSSSSTVPLFDEIWILPVYQHTFSSKRNKLLGYNHRVTMCQIAFGDDDSDGNITKTKKVIVSRAEQRSWERLVRNIQSEEERQSLRVGTADLLDMLIEEEGQKPSKSYESRVEFSFCLGADTFMDLTSWKWKRSKDVMRLLDGRLIVIHRKGTSNETELQERVQHINANENGQVMFLYVPTLQDISSSMARQITNEDELRKIVPPKVVDYIVSNKLYGFEDDSQNNNQGNSDNEDNNKADSSASGA
jgi:predicted GNAT family N-acyltransferase/nicotinic acid mononucleotide adenylyltransferase